MSVAPSTPEALERRKETNAGASIHQGKQQNVDLMLTMVPQMAILAAPHLP